MEAQGFIQRRADAEDKRRVRVFLTEEGLVARKQIRELVIELNARLHELLGENAAGQLLEGLAKLNELLEAPEQLIPTNWAPLNDKTLASS